MEVKNHSHNHGQIQVFNLWSFFSTEGAEGVRTQVSGAISQGRHLCLKAGLYPNQPIDIDKASAGHNELLVTAVKMSH